MRRNKSAFTLIELMVVVVIIGILAGLVLGITSYATRKASTSNAIAEIETIRNALEEYRLEHQGYPVVSNVTPVLDVAFRPYREWMSNNVSDVVNPAIFEDPWGQSYQYESLSKYRYRLYSLGQDLVDGTGDEVDSSKGSY